MIGKFKINSLDIGMIIRYSCSLIISDVVTNERERRKRQKERYRLLLKTAFTLYMLYAIFFYFRRLVPV